MRHRVGALTLLAVFAIAVTSSSGRATAASGYLLPVPAGTQAYVTQGNSTKGHSATLHSQYAFDFGVAGNPPFPVVAARAGTVIGMRSDSTNTTCRSLACWTDANYVLVDHGDGTAALYLHLATGTVKVTREEYVSRGQALATADSTGYTEGKTHLHFMVEDTPSPGAQKLANSTGWWWTNSVPVAFDDPSILASFPSGVPTNSGPFASSNSAPAPGGPMTYVVAKGDTISSIARRFHLTFEQLLKANPGLIPDTLRIGQSLVIPAPSP